MNIPPATPAAAPPRPGKSGASVGHLARAAATDARASGIDLPKNAQGMAASSIARGADPASVFAALVAPDPGVPVGAGVTPAIDATPPEVADDGPAPDVVPDDVVPDDAGAGNLVAAGGMDGADTALALLQAGDAA